MIKPNQPLNVVLRALKSIANINPDGLSHQDPNYVSISKIEYIAGYSQKQIDLLYEHDLVFDEQVPDRYKKNHKLPFYGMFEGQPVVMAQISGTNALSKLKALVGQKDPVKGNQNSLLK